MLYSKLFGKTRKTIKEFDSINATLLQKAGFVDQTMAGVYTFLTLGLRVLAKIENIIRVEMDEISSEIGMPSIVPKILWEQTGRLQTVDVLMKTIPANAAAKLKNDAEYVLNSTHEEVVTPIAQKLYQSYKDFPFAVYQIQSKFRNEPRAKSGLLRCREFRMKDLYSFHTSEEDLKKYYETVKRSYWNIFNRLDLDTDTFLTLASGGDFTEDYSHEFQTVCSAGEDTVFHVKSKNITFNREVAPSKAIDLSNAKEQILPMQEVKGENIIKVEALAKYLNIPIEKTTKTLLFENENSQVIAAALRGGYNVNEEKLRKITGSKNLTLASPEVVKRVTGAEVGYVGILHLPKEVRVYMDESMKGRKNFESGANKTYYHAINVNFGRDIPIPKNFYDFKVAKDGDFYPETGEKYEVYKAAEIGNIFPLYTKFTKAINYYFTDEKGAKNPIFMGCYGIGSSRIMGVIVEKFHDERGIVWPSNIAPFQVHLIGLDLNDDTIKKQAFKIYKLLTTTYNLEVLFDDRVETRAGEKFSDADLIGIPYRLVVSKRTGEKVELKKRTDNNSMLLTPPEILSHLK